MNGVGGAQRWGIEDIRRITENAKLHPGTINVAVHTQHELRRDFTLHRNERQDGRDEELYFESCWLRFRDIRMPAFIARTSTNFHGTWILEVMAELVEGLQAGDEVGVEVETT